MSQLYLRQLLVGRDLAVDDRFARQMANYIYVIGDRDAKEAMVIDCAYAPKELVDVVEADGMHLTGAVVTHYHADHAGGSIAGHPIEGVVSLLAERSVPVHIQSEERRWIAEWAGVGAENLVLHDSGDRLLIGDLPVTLIHTPGHTEGSQCILFEGQLFTGDTLFLNGCGRTDLPGGDPVQLFESLSRRLASISDSTPIFPGHAYDLAPSALMGTIRQTNPVLAPLDRANWLARFS